MYGIRAGKQLSKPCDRVPRITCKTAEDFLTITQAIKGKPLSYAGGNVPRPRAIENSEIYQATTEDQAVTIELHHEMAYSSSFPSKVL